MIYCPFCYDQGVIYKAKIKENRMNIYICDECDTVWKNTEINEDNCENFETLMNSLCYKALWSELTEIERL